MSTSLLESQPVTTFTDYFKLNIDIEDVLAFFGYTFQSAYADLPRTAQPLPWQAELRTRLETSLPYLSLTSEMARREFLIAPVLLDLARYMHVKIKVEFPLDVTDRLRGTLDYYLQGTQNLLVIEAKNADLQKGFTQLAVELIALDQWHAAQTGQLYGAVSIGNVWQFGVLDRSTRLITQDLSIYRVPADLPDLLQILVGILEGPGIDGSAEFAE
ncbi:MAG: hypothetical protein ACLFVO_14100 [Chloroflexaceae bacterium]